jgi:hypothetical protein
MGDRRTTGILLAIAIFIPLGDGLVILSHLGFAPPIYIHWGTAFYMMIVAAFLLRRKAPDKVAFSLQLHRYGQIKNESRRGSAFL